MVAKWNVQVMPQPRPIFQPPPPSPVVRDNDNRGDLMIRGFWSCGTNCIVDVRITDLDSKSYLKKSSNKVLAGQEQEKKEHGNISRNFAPRTLLWPSRSNLTGRT
eukprot:scaffold15430_cov40-Attheya_sp.AAC.1